jgi:hypothetical protein
MSITVTPRTLALNEPIAPISPAVARGAAAVAVGLTFGPSDQTPRRPIQVRQDRWILAGLVVGMLLFYGLLQNPYWVPSGDSEVYIASAREMALGHGYRFNGQPVAIIPPGWPALMALVMLIIPYVLPLKLLSMGCMVGSLALGYRIARRFASPRTAALSIALTAIISPVYQATFWLISEGLFCLISAGALLVALQIAEGRSRWGRIALLAVLCAAAVTVRWAGLLGWVLVAGVLISGNWRQAHVLAVAGACTIAGLLGDLIPGVPAAAWARVLGVGAASIWMMAATVRMEWWRDRRWVATMLAGTLTLATFWATRQLLAVTPEQAVAAAEFGGAGEDVPLAGQEAMYVPVSGTDTQAAGSYALLTGTYRSTGYVARFMQWGRWLGLLYWQPFRAAAGSAWIEAVSNVAGWILLLLLGVVAASAARRRELIWVGLLLYCLALALNWPFATARYLVPVAPLLTLGILLGAGHLRGWATARRWERTVAVATGTFITALVTCNLALWAVDVSIARSDDFYSRYETGIHSDLIAAGMYLREAGVGDRQVVITPRYVNLNRARNSPFGLRVMNLVTGRSVVSLPRHWLGTPPGPKLARFLYRSGYRYYVHQTPVSPWRVWHFRMGWWQRMRTGQEPMQLDSGWELYRIDGLGEMPLVELPRTANWPVRVPGLGDAGVSAAPAGLASAMGEQDHEQH